MKETLRHSYLVSDYLSFTDIMNRLGSKRVPFLFVLDYDLKNPIIIPLDKLNETGILFNIEGRKNYTTRKIGLGNKFYFAKYPVSYETYHKAYEIVHKHLVKGNSYLVNLTFPSRIESSCGLAELFHLANARFKLLVPEKFAVFSPEIFIRIKDGWIYAYPMKGTADASDPDQADKILSGYKEQAEHNTIVDLIRNDLSQVACDVRVERFAYREIITTHEKKLIQVSSEISGHLPANYCAHLGTLFAKILPAGSVTGAPKFKTLEIIRKAEIYQRGYYTGVFGIFDGSDLDSAVMIRFIEQTPSGLIYKSGGGITAYSDPLLEYREMIDKVYVPIA